MKRKWRERRSYMVWEASHIFLCIQRRQLKRMPTVETVLRWKNTIVWITKFLFHEKFYNYSEGICNESHCEKCSQKIFLRKNLTRSQLLWGIVGIFIICKYCEPFNSECTWDKDIVFTKLWNCHCTSVKLLDVSWTNFKSLNKEWDLQTSINWLAKIRNQIHFEVFYNNNPNDSKHNKDHMLDAPSARKSTFRVFCASHICQHLNAHQTDSYHRTTGLEIVFFFDFHTPTSP